MVQLCVPFVPLANEARCIAHEGLLCPLVTKLAAILLYHVL